MYAGKLASAEEFTKDLHKSADWVTARYRHNRGIIHDGDYPHLSTPVSYLRPGLKRVILGFNCFPAATGECCMRAPEHSDAFNRTIKLYQTMAALGVPITAFSSSESGGKYAAESALSELDTTAGTVEAKGYFVARDTKETGSNRPVEPVAKRGMNVKDIMKNPALAKLLVTAAKKLTAHEKKEKELQLDRERRSAEAGQPNSQALSGPDLL